jgi:hypothetical protein
MSNELVSPRFAGAHRGLGKQEPPCPRACCGSTAHVSARHGVRTINKLEEHLWGQGAWFASAAARALAAAGRTLTECVCFVPLQVRHLIHAINEASSKIPGWDEYAKTGKATELWDGVL